MCRAYNSSSSSQWYNVCIYVLPAKTIMSLLSAFGPSEYAHQRIHVSAPPLQCTRAMSVCDNDISCVYKYYITCTVYTVDEEVWDTYHLSTYVERCPQLLSYNNNDCCCCCWYYYAYAYGSYCSIAFRINAIRRRVYTSLRVFWRATVCVRSCGLVTWRRQTVVVRRGGGRACPRNVRTLRVA